MTPVCPSLHFNTPTLISDVVREFTARNSKFADGCREALTSQFYQQHCNRFLTTHRVGKLWRFPHETGSAPTGGWIPRYVPFIAMICYVS
jgi:hypothetical protein